MSILDTFWFVVLSPTFQQQIAPIFVLLLVPTLVLAVATRRERSSLVHSFLMGLDSLGYVLPWNWYSNVAGNGTHDRKKKKKKSRHASVTDLVELDGLRKEEAEEPSLEDGYYPGLVNISGTYCFMNSTLQALASLSYLQPHIDAIQAKAEALDVPSPVIDALRVLFKQLNTPHSYPTSLKPVEIIQVLSSPPPLLPGANASDKFRQSQRANSLFNSREHQDAQELFQLLSECIKDEIASVDREGLRDRGLASVSGDTSSTSTPIGKSVFDGLTANRRSCVVCGYTEAVMHFGFDNWQLAVPMMGGSCSLEMCLADYTRLEILSDCVCRKCSLLATHKRLQAELHSLDEVLSSTTAPSSSKSLSSPADLFPSEKPNKPSASKKRRYKEVKRMETRVRSALADARIEDEMKDVRIERVVSPSTKQAMIARPPPVLALHLNRSFVHAGYGAVKNTIRVKFPEYLDLSPYTTGGSLSLVPTKAISESVLGLGGRGEGGQVQVQEKEREREKEGTHEKTLYRLAAVVCHYGQHAFGHYVCYRRKPPLRPPRSPDDDEDDDERRGRGAGRGWLRVSDDAARECGIENVLAEGSGAFMLYYERVLPGGPYSPLASSFYPVVGATSSAPIPIPVPSQRESEKYLNGNTAGNGGVYGSGSLSSLASSSASGSRSSSVLGASREQEDWEREYALGRIYASRSGRRAGGPSAGDDDGGSTGSEETLKPEGTMMMRSGGGVGASGLSVVGVLKRRNSGAAENGKDRGGQRTPTRNGSRSPPPLPQHPAPMTLPRVVRSVAGPTRDRGRSVSSSLSNLPVSLSPGHGSLSPATTTGDANSNSQPQSNGRRSTSTLISPSSPSSRSSSASPTTTKSTPAKLSSSNKHKTHSSSSSNSKPSSSAPGTSSKHAASGKTTSPKQSQPPPSPLPPRIHSPPQAQPQVGGLRA